MRGAENQAGMNVTLVGLRRLPDEESANGAEGKRPRMTQGGQSRGRVWGGNGPPHVFLASDL